MQRILAWGFVVFSLCLTLVNGPVRAGSEAGAAPATGLQAALRGVVSVYSDDREERFLGSAVIWGDGLLVVSNAHVVGNRSRVELRHGGAWVVAQVVRVDAARDLALLALEVPVFGTGLPLGRAQLMQEVYAIGAPLEVAGSVSRGIVSALDRQIEAHVPVGMIQHDAAVNPGSSGGALVDAEGRLLGINSQIADGSRLFVGIAYALPVALVAAFVAGRLRAVVTLGLQGRAVNRAVAEALGLVRGRGVLVDDVTAGGLAAAAGLRPGDVILSLDGQIIRAVGDLAYTLDRRQAEVLRAEVWRAGALIEVALELRVTPPPLRLARAEAGARARGLLRVEAYDLAGLGVALVDGSTEIAALTPASPAYMAGLNAGDRIVAVNGQQIGAMALRQLTLRKPVLLLVQRADGSHVHIPLDPWRNGTPLRPLGGANMLDPDVVNF
ncbi:trypsin-like peptidase domain-containing protein [Thalassobius sp. MITS945101]|uniref:S1C family serine protease n=1 Tax=Thalassobius sp. MITS945101 TaxID=3096994 RepID=UPI003999F1AE